MRTTHTDPATGKVYPIWWIPLALGFLIPVIIAMVVVILQLIVDLPFLEFGWK